jgi:DNA-directed RNA polymerase I, II, and III subunit RPABC1
MSRTIETLKEMMSDRNQQGWVKSEHSEDVFLSGFYLIFISKSEKFNIETMKQMIYFLQAHKLTNGIIVYQNIITSLAKKAIEHLQDYNIETFEKKELQYNPTHHRFYCPHTRLKKEDVKKEIKIELVHLPILLRTDMISRYFGFKKGDVVRIERKNGSIAYRLVK